MHSMRDVLIFACRDDGHDSCSIGSLDAAVGRIPDADVEG